MRLDLSRAGAIALATLAVASPARARAQNAAAANGGSHTFTVQAAFALKTIGQVAQSPDGRWVAYTVEEKDLEKNATFRNIRVASSDGASTRQVTRGRATNGEIAWHPDSKRIAYVSDRGGAAALWTTNADSGEGREGRALATGGQPVSRPAWSPDGRSIAYIAAEAPDEHERADDKLRKGDAHVIDYLRHPARLWVIPADGSGPARRLTTGSRQVNELAWSPDGKRIAVMTSPATGEYEGLVETHVTLVTVASGEAHDLQVDRSWSFADLTWSPDGKFVAFRTSYPGLKLMEGRINLVDVNTGARKMLPPDFDGGVSGYAWTAPGTIVYNAAVGVVGRLFRYDVAGDRATPLGTAGEQLFRNLSSNRAGTQLAFAARDATNPGDAYVAALASFAPRRLSEANASLAGLRLGATETVTWKGADGWSMDGVLVKPADYQAGKRYPTIVYVHGGPSGVNAKAFDPFWQLMAARGYAVLAPNPRGGSGHGDKFYAANYRDFGGKDYQDIMAGVDRVIEMGVADANQLGVWGWSYGGYMTYWIVSHTGRFKAAMSGAGMANLASFYAQSEIQSVWAPSYFDASPYKDPELYRRLSPITFVDHVTTPTLILYGGSDIRVPPPQGREFYVALREKHVPTQLVYYPREGHAIREPDHERDRWERSIAWFDRYVRGVGATP